MQRAIRGKAWSIVFCAPLLSAATVTLFINALTVPAHGNHCTKFNDQYADVIVNAMKAIERHEPACPEWKKALAAATALKELSLRKDCYHGKIGGMADNVQRFTAQETGNREGVQLFCEFGECFNETGDVAIAACTRAINLGTFAGLALSTLYTSRGIAYNATGGYDRAIGDYSEAIRIDPKNSGYWNSRCWARATAGRDLEQALSDCNESLRLKPNDANTIGSRGLVYLRLNRLDDAIADYNAVLKVDPTRASSLYGRGIAKLLKGDTAAGYADIAAAKAARANIAEEFAKYGIRPGAAVAAPRPSAPASPPSADCAQAETHWKSVEEIRTLAVYEDHLARFPNCDFATLAKARIEALKK